MYSTEVPKRSSRYSHQLPIESGYHSNLWVRPLIIWGIGAVIIMCACSPANKWDHYHFDSCLFWLFGLTVFILLTGLMNAAGTRRIYIDEEKLVFLDMSGKAKETYLLKNIRNFRWSNQPRVTRTRYGGQMTAKNEVIELTFDSGSFSLSFDDYGNFGEIKCYLYDYCLDHGIVKMRTLKKRKQLFGNY